MEQKQPIHLSVKYRFYEYMLHLQLQANYDTQKLLSAANTVLSMPSFGNGAYTYSDMVNTESPDLEPNQPYVGIKPLKATRGLNKVRRAANDILVAFFTGPNADHVSIVEDFTHICTSGLDFVYLAYPSMRVALEMASIRNDLNIQDCVDSSKLHGSPASGIDESLKASRKK